MRVKEGNKWNMHALAVGKPNKFDMEESIEELLKRQEDLDRKFNTYRLPNYRKLCQIIRSEKLRKGNVGI